LKEICETLDQGLNRFCNRIKALIRKGLPSIYVINDKLITQEDYALNMKEMARRSIKVSGIMGSMIEK